MSYLSRRIGRAVIRLDPKRNSAEDILYSKIGTNKTRRPPTTLLHEIKALQQITYLKLTRTFINVIQAKNGALLALHLINVD